VWVFVGGYPTKPKKRVPISPPSGKKEAGAPLKTRPTERENNKLHFPRGSKKFWKGRGGKSERMRDYKKSISTSGTCSKGRDGPPCKEKRRSLSKGKPHNRGEKKKRGVSP